MYNSITKFTPRVGKIYPQLRTPVLDELSFLGSNCKKKVFRSSFYWKLG